MLTIGTTWRCFAEFPQAADGCILVAGRRSDWSDHKARGVLQNSTIEGLVNRQVPKLQELVRSPF